MKAEIKFTQDYGKTWAEPIIIEANTADALFEKYYNMNRHYRYCNGWYYRFVENDMEREYNAWYKGLSHDRSFSLYYGSGIVD